MKVLRQPEGTLTIRWLDTKTIEGTFVGKLNEELIDFLIREFWSVAGDRVPQYALFECSEVTSYNAKIRTRVVRFLTDFKLRGGREILGITSAAPLRMFAQAITFASGLPLKLFSTREQALTYIVSKMKDT